MDAVVALYALIICAEGHIPCQYQLASYKSLTRQECVDRSMMIRWRHPELRVLCITPKHDDVIDSARHLGPSYMTIAPTYEADDMDVLGRSPRR